MNVKLARSSCRLPAVGTSPFFRSSQFRGAARRTAQIAAAALALLCLETRGALGWVNAIPVAAQDTGEVDRGDSTAELKAEAINAPPAKPPEMPTMQARLMALDDGRRFQDFVQTSTREAELFRRSLLAPLKFDSDEMDGDSAGRADEADIVGSTSKQHGFPNLASAVAAASIQFQQSIGQQASEPSQSIDDGKERAHPALVESISHFRLEANEIVAAIAGTRELPSPDEFYSPFSGRWYGLWESNQVNHAWGEYQKLKEPRLISLGQPAADDGETDASVKLLGYQYAWVGDGYGLNHVAQSSDGRASFLLGYVVHLRDQDWQRETARRPHVGVAAGPGKLIWITKSEVFFEELIEGDSPSYVITGFRYEVVDASQQDASGAQTSNSVADSGKLLRVTTGFQSVYTRKPERRTPWRAIPIEFSLNLGR